MHEDVFDRLASQIQSIQDQVDRSFGVSESFDPALLALRLKPETGKVLGWDSGSVLTNKTLDSSAVALPGGGRTVATLSAYIANNAVFNVKDWGVVMNNVADDTVRAQACYADANAFALAQGGVNVLWPHGNSKIIDTITVNQHRVHTWGMGKYASTITFNPATAKPLFKCQAANSAQVIYQGSFFGLSFTGVGTQQKKAIQLIDSSEFNITSCTTNSWTGNSGSSLTPSCALETNGREWLVVFDVDWYADRPIWIRRNANAPVGSCDHFSLIKCLLSPQVSTESSIHIDGDAGVSNLTIDQHAWVSGKYGIRYAAGTPPSTALGIWISNVRREQFSDATGFSVSWENATSGLTLANVGLGNGNGIYLRNCGAVYILSPIHSGAAGTVALDMDNTCDNVRWENAQWGTLSTANVGTMVLVRSSPQRDSNAPLPPSATYVNPVTTIIAEKLGGGYKYEYGVTVASGGTFPIPLLTVGNGMKTAIVSVYGRSATGPIDEYGDACISTTTVFIKGGGSANFVNTNTALKLCLFFNGGNPVTLLNNTAQALSVLIKVDARYI